MNYRKYSEKKYTSYSRIERLSYIQKLQELKLFSLDYWSKRGDMIQLFKILNNIEDIKPESCSNFLHQLQKVTTENCINLSVTKDSDSTLFVFALLILGINCHRKRWILKI